jgi:hypothetical protein
VVQELADRHLREELLAEGHYSHFGGKTAYLTLTLDVAAAALGSLGRLAMQPAIRENGGRWAGSGCQQASMIWYMRLGLVNGGELNMQCNSASAPVFGLLQAKALFNVGNDLLVFEVRVRQTAVGEDLIEHNPCVAIMLSFPDYLAKPKLQASL